MFRRSCFGNCFFTIRYVCFLVIFVEVVFLLELVYFDLFLEVVIQVLEYLDCSMVV